jgi:hypothetical protein
MYNATATMPLKTLTLIANISTAAARTARTTATAVITATTPITTTIKQKH